MTSETQQSETTQPAWAVWLYDQDRNDECVSVCAATKSAAKSKAISESDIVGAEVEEIHVDGPFEDAEPAVFEFEFITEHRERVVVEGPTEQYARESADHERNYRGEYTETIHTNVRRVPKEDDSL